MTEQRIVSVETSNNYPDGVHIPSWVMPASSVVFSVVATSVTITVFLSKLQNRLTIFDTIVSAKFDNLLLQLKYKDENLLDLKDKVTKLENNFNQLTRYINRNAPNGQAFTARNNSVDNFQTFS